MMTPLLYPPKIYRQRMYPYPPMLKIRRVKLPTVYYYCLLLLLLPLFLPAQPVADQTFKVDGTHAYAYAFAAGDQVDLHVQLLTGRQLKVVEFLQYPDRSLFRSYELDTMLDKRIAIPQTGVYLLQITEKGLGKKVCRFTLHRTPESPQTARLDTRIGWDWRQNQPYQISVRQVPAGKKNDVASLGGQVTVNAGKFGLKKSTNAYQFTLPPNTVRWAYRISVGQATQEARRRDAEKVTGVLKSAGAKLLGYEPESALAIFALGLAIDMSVSTAGEDVEYALVNGDNLPKYYAGQEYETFIYQAGVAVDVQRRYTPTAGTYYFALRSNNWMDDITVNIDIEAVTETPLFVEEIYLEMVRP